MALLRKGFDGVRNVTTTFSESRFDLDDLYTVQVWLKQRKSFEAWLRINLTD